MEDLILIYLCRLNGYDPSRREDDKLGYAVWMCYEVLAMLRSEVPDLNKINRWVGFIQCILWVTGTYTIDEMRDQTRKLNQVP